MEDRRLSPYACAEGPFAAPLLVAAAAVTAVTAAAGEGSEDEAASRLAKRAECTGGAAYLAGAADEREEAPEGGEEDRFGPERGAERGAERGGP